MNFIGRFEEVLAAEARRVGADGVICGHIHHAADREIEGLRYVNTGDWVESCTAVVEHYDGRLELIRFADQIKAGALSSAGRDVLSGASDARAVA